MRCFVAIPIPEDIKEYLQNLQKEIKQTIEDNATINYVKEFHLTLQFLGDIEEKAVDEIKQKISEINFSKFKLILGNAGFFPTEDYIRVVWIGFKDDKIINNLQKLINEKLDFKEDERFHAHLTLGRVKFIKDKNLFKEKINDLQLQELEFKVNSFNLIKSELKPEGPVYTDLTEFKLE